MMLLRVPENGTYMLAAYVVTAVVLGAYALRLLARVKRGR